MVVTVIVAMVIAAAAAVVLGGSDGYEPVSQSGAGIRPRRSCKHRCRDSKRGKVPGAKYPGKYVHVCVSDCKCRQGIKGQPLTRPPGKAYS
jgi:hypothetical protein